MDNRSSIDNSVDTRACEQLHDGWIYPYIASDRNYCSLDKNYSGAKNHIGYESMDPARAWLHRLQLICALIMRVM